MGCTASSKNKSKANQRKNNQNNHISSSQKSKTNDTKGGSRKQHAEASEDAANQADQQLNPYLTTLTQKDIFHLKMSWKGIRRSLEVTGVTMFLK